MKLTTPDSISRYSGFGVSASRLGYPDAGILTLSEMEDTAKSVIRATGGKIPVIVDGDTGYGGAVNIRRTVRGLASVGAAAVTIEDQVFPKCCTYAAGTGVRVISRNASQARVRTAIAAREEARDIDGRDILSEWKNLKSSLFTFIFSCHEIQYFTLCSYYVTSHCTD